MAYQKSSQLPLRPLAPSPAVNQPCNLPSVPRPLGTPQPLFLFLLFLFFPLLLFCSLPAPAEEVSFAWDPNAEEDIEGYQFYYGFGSRSYAGNYDVGNTTNHTMFLPFGGETYFFAVTAYNTNKYESDFSNEVSLFAIEEPGTILATNQFTFFTNEDQSVDIPWQSAFLDLPTVVVYVAEPPKLGSIVGSATNLVYEPRPDVHGPDHFRLILADTNRNVLKLELSIEIAAINDIPIAEDSYISVDRNSPTPIFLSAYDPDNDVLTFTIISGPSHGFIEGEPPNLIYWPDNDYVGPDLLTWRAADNQSESGDATVHIQVELINDPPIAGDMELTTAEDQPLDIVLPVFDPDGDPIFISILEGPSAGTLSGVPPVLVYTPFPDYYGTDSFSYIVEDEYSNSGLAHVTITVLPVNDPPVISPTSFETDEDTPIELRFSIDDADGDPVQVRILTAPTRGILTGNLPNLIYTPATNYHGLDSFRLEASDGQSPPVRTTISILIRPVNDRPLAYSATVELTQTETANIQLEAIDFDGDALVYRVIDLPQHGRLSGTPPHLQYRPWITYSGTDRISFVVSDGILESAPASVHFQVLPLEDPTILVPHIVRTDTVGHNTRIIWTSWAGGIYRIRQRPSLLSSNWESVLDEIEAVGQLSTAEIPMPAGSTQFYYLVELVR